MAKIQDVAKAAGVSIATVSRVLNGATNVDPELKLKVEAAIKQLDYHPSSAARSMRRHRSRLVGVIVDDIPNPFTAKVVQGLENEMMRNDYSVILCNSKGNYEREQKYLEVLYNERVAGVVIVPTEEKISKTTQRQFRERGIPLVALDRYTDNYEIDTVLTDNIRGAYDAVNHLITNGYRRIGAIMGPLIVTTGRDRMEGYRRALTEAGLPLDHSLEHHGHWTIQTSRQVTLELLNMRPAIDAIFTGSNIMALGAIDVIRALNLRIPDDVALVGYDLVGYDDVPYVEFWSTPELTTVIQPAYEMGQTAAQRLIQRLASPMELGPQKIVLASTLRVGSSSQPRASGRQS